MEIDLNRKQLDLKNELKEYFKSLMTQELKNELSNSQFFEGGGPEFKKTLKQMGQDGWIGLSWSKSLGGKEFSPLEQYIFIEWLPVIVALIFLYLVFPPKLIFNTSLLISFLNID